MRRFLVAAALIAVFVAGRPIAAAAAVPQTAGWWWEAEQGAPVPPPPTVPAGGFMVGADPSGANAVAALRFQLAPDQTNPTITLTVADSGNVNDAGGAILASRASKAWTAAAPGNWADRPSGVAPSVKGARSEDGKSWTFNVAALLDGTTLDVVFEPDPTTSFAVTFNPPNDQTLRTSAKPPAAGLTTYDDSSAGASSGAVTPVVAESGALVPTAPAVVPSASEEIALEVSPPQQQGSAALARGALPGPARTHEAAGLALLLGAAVVGAGWALSRRPPPALRTLGPMSSRGDRMATPVVPAGRTHVGGLGRFARERVGPPPKL